MATKNYTVEAKEKVIYAVVSKLNDKETREVKKFLDLGFSIVPVEPKKLTKEEKEAAQIANPYSKINVEAFLKREGNEALFAEYQSRYNEQAGTNRTETQEDGTKVSVPDQPKFCKNGKPLKKGFANCIGWFRAKFAWDEETKDYIPAKK